MPVVIVAGALANKPGNGGGAWERLSWVLGLRRLDFDVWFLEQIAAPTLAQRQWFQNVTAWFGVAAESVLIEGDVLPAALLEIAKSAVLLVNLSGHLTHPALLDSIGCKVYVDVDPGFTQAWHADPANAFQLSGHDFYYTIGERIGTPGCPIPTGGIAWRHVRQPVVLNMWGDDAVNSHIPGPLLERGGEKQTVLSPPLSKRGPWMWLSTSPRFSTVASWRGPFGTVVIDGQTFGLKVHEFRKVLALPRLVPEIPFEIALDIHTADTADHTALLAHGWQLSDPVGASGTPAAFRDFIRGSWAEFSVAQGVYAGTQSGWFSDRTTRYLAAGKPALVQDTGFAGLYPVGEGLVPFRTLGEAVEGARRIAADYDLHCRAARRVAAECFDSDRVLKTFTDDLGVRA